MVKKEENDLQQNTPEVINECGLAAVYLTKAGQKERIDLTSLIYQAASDLQHRAEGAAGMWISSKKEVGYVRELGTVAVAFQEGRKVPRIRNPKLAMVHTRYPTAGSSTLKENIQPLYLDDIWLGHHGNLTNAQAVEESIKPILKGNKYPDSDSWIALNAIVKAKGKTLAEKVINAQKKFEGGWVFIVSDGKSFVATRDSYGVRPLSVGIIGSRANPKGYVLSVESFAFHNAKIVDFREVLPGETIVIDEKGIRTVDLSPKGKLSCIFEFVYMSHPGSKLAGQLVYDTRRRAGELLWHEAPITLTKNEQLVVMPVPNSGRPSALGFFFEAQKALGDKAIWDEGILANPYFGRNFIKSYNERAAALKYIAIPEIFKGRTVAIVDDSIVRGDTLKDLIQICKKAGATKIHVRIPSPEIKHPCFWGVAFSTYSELLANKLPNMRERENFLGITSLRHLSIDGLLKAVVGPGETNKPTTGFCTYCFNKKGPPMNGIGTIPLNERKLNIDKSNQLGTIKKEV